VTLAIRALTQDELPAFFAYLDDHLLDNGAPGLPLFQPLPPKSGFPPDKRSAFRSGMAAPVGRAGWRRAWIAVDGDGMIAGHIDLRARPEAPAFHRALLGMGVHRACRRQGLGLRLIEAARQWAMESGLHWIDLEVLSVNHAAHELYLRAGFRIVGEFDDMYRIDGKSLACTLMTLPLPVRLLKSVS
jgi:ribosomal protein S18 acetylase RimI-like enzyme